MTRPIERLYINQEYKKASKFAELFHGVLTQIDGVKTEIEGGFKLSLGEQKEIIRLSENDEAPHFIPKNVADRLWFPDISLQDQKDLTDQNTLSDAQRFGNQLHILLSIVNTVTEIDSCVNDLNKSGEIEVEFIERLKLEIHEILTDNDYKELFVDCTDILSEQPIILDEFTTIRPDKIILKEVEVENEVEIEIEIEIEKIINQKAIVLDYKTGLPNKKYTKQVTEYALALKEIGYIEVEAYLFYTATKKLERII
jgi:hypothetical protein